jgi:hypothetical protein
MDDKALLLARLATARAAYWQELIGLDIAHLENEHICGEWNAADALAHIAAWDEIHSERVRLLDAGRARDIKIGVTDSINAHIFEERHGWTLSQAVGACNQARAGFLALIAPLSWEDMQYSHRVSSRAEFSIRELTERRAFHDNLHVDDLRSWRRYASPTPRPGPAVVLRAALDAARAELLAWGELLPAAERAARPVCGEWTLQDVLGHVADWEQYAVDVLDDMAAGRMAGLTYDGDEEGWNHQHAKARRGQPWETILDDLAAIRVALLARLDHLDDDTLAAPARSRLSDDDTPYNWFTISLDHDREHAGILRDALTARS